MSSRLGIAAIFYGVLVAAALIWSGLAGRTGIGFFLHPEGLWGQTTWFALLSAATVGILFGLGVAKLSQYMVRRYRWSRLMHIEFRGLLGPLDSVDILAFALFSSIGEEMFFRGAMQPAFGIAIASVVFGGLHIGPDKKFLPWPFFALAMGFAFGALFWLTGNLIAPILAHFVINYQNLHFINKYDPSHHRLMNIE